MRTSFDGSYGSQRAAAMAKLQAMTEAPATKGKAKVFRSNALDLATSAACAKSSTSVQGWVQCMRAWDGEYASGVEVLCWEAA